MKLKGRIKKEEIIKAFERKQAEILLRFLDMIDEVIKVKDFNELKGIVRELAEAQKKSEERLTRLEETVQELVEAQKRTEQSIKELIEAQKRSEERISKAEERLTRLEATVQELAEAQKRTEQRVNELVEAQKRTEQRINELAEAQRVTEQRVNELVEAQKRTEQRINELAEAQKVTEQRVNELAEAQKKTEDVVRKLTESLHSLREEVGGLSHTIGYRLEDEAMKSLPALLKRDMEIEVIGRLRRDFLEVAPHKYIELNIWGEGEKNGKRYVIIGEAKSQLKKRDVDDFIKKVEEIKRYISEEQICVLVTYITSPDVKRYAEEKGIKIYFSYEL